MPERFITILDLFITGFLSTFALMFSFTIIPVIVAILNGIYIVSRIKRDADRYHNGSFWKLLAFILKKNK